MRVNFVDGSESDQGLRLIGTDGVIIFGWNDVKVIRHKLNPEPGYGGWDSYETFSESQRKEYEKWYKAKYPVKPATMSESDLEFKAPEDYSADVHHHANFYKGIRENAPIKEDALFGMQAAGPALATNKSLFEKKIINWDPLQAKVIS
jgi:hypothetical protein